MITAEFLERRAMNAPTPNRAERRRLARSPARQAAHALGRALHAGPAVETRVAAVPGWLRLSALDAIASYLNGRAHTCPHLPRLPVVAAAWRPGVAVCLQCMPVFHVADATVNATCDGCGHVCAGLPDDPITPGIAQVGQLVFLYGVCRDCQRDVPGGSQHRAGAT